MIFTQPRPFLRESMWVDAAEVAYKIICNRLSAECEGTRVAYRPVYSNALDPIIAGPGDDRRPSAQTVPDQEELFPIDLGIFSAVEVVNRGVCVGGLG